MSNISLWQASDEYRDLCEHLYNSTDEDGVVNADVFDNMLAAKATFETKAIAVAMVVRQYDKDIANLNEEIERLKQLKDRLKAKKERLTESLSRACETTGTERIEGVYASVSFRNNPPSVKIDDENEIPYDYIREKVTRTYEPDKVKIKEAILRGETVPGAHLEQERKMQIK